MTLCVWCQAASFSWQVQRRYSEFVTLWNYLTYETQSVRPFPPAADTNAQSPSA